MENVQEKLDEKILNWDKKDYFTFAESMSQEEMDAMKAWLSVYSFFTFPVDEETPHLAQDKLFVLQTYITHWLYDLIEAGEKGSIVQDLLECYLALPF